MRKRNIVAGLVGVAVVVAAASRMSMRRFRIVDDSMEPSLVEGDFIVARRRNRDLERGDIVVFQDPAGSSMNFVKRVIGTEGEHMGIVNGRVTVNGALLADRWASGSSFPEGEWEIPEGHVWLLSDNRGATLADGRTFGPTPQQDIDWIVSARYYPPQRAGAVA